MNQKLFEFLSAKGFTPMMSDYEEIRHLMSLEHCTPNERAFLDEIREKMELSEDFEGDPDYAIHIPTGSSMLFQSDFTKSNLKELVNANRLQRLSPRMEN